MTACAPALGHEIRPAYLQIREIETSTYDVLWKTPAQGDMRLALNALMPASCRNLGLARGTLVNAAAIEQQRQGWVHGTADELWHPSDPAES